MELTQLRYVLAVAETRNFTRAAQQCHVVQSALSHQVKALEHELGVDLFARTSRRVDLTQAGEAFLPSAQACLEAADRAMADAVATTGELCGTLTVGAIPTVSGVDLPAALGKLRQEHSQVKVSLRVGNSNEFVEDIAAGRLDVAVLGVAASVDPLASASSRTAVRVEEVAREKLVAVLPSSHRLAHRKRLRLEDLVEDDFVDFPEGGSGRQQSDLAFRTAGLGREVAFETATIDLQVDLVRQGLAVALLAQSVVDQGDTAADIVTVPVTNGPERVIYLAWSSFNPSPSALALLGILQASASPS
ncbi:MAG TPA: LysR family transcriptional regulator [Candidatus Corynebacterium avicola]|uniref:LysR family transcriptional regulator n=1 Tax=Candidatus Corynebacterium avicola TaxID=2838527 RepID=A0A9D1UK33_9CORY|nr:LysR family transcriptional regulator [Candidatus Corynebacterium avicola]